MARGAQEYQPEAEENKGNDNGKKSWVSWSTCRTGLQYTLQIVSTE